MLIRRSTQHLLAATVAASALALTGCGGTDPESKTDVLDPVVQDDPTTPEPTEPTDGIPADFPLDAALDDPPVDDGEQTVDGPASTADGAHPLTACGRDVPFPTSDGADPAFDLSYSVSSVEGYDGRTVHAYPTRGKATQAMTDVLVALEGCARDDGGDGLSDRVFASYASDAGDESISFGWTYEQEDGVGAPAGQLFTVARSGRLVLTVEWSSEGSADYRAAAVTDQLALVDLILPSAPDDGPSDKPQDADPAPDPDPALDVDLDVDMVDMRGDGGDYVTTYRPKNTPDRLGLELCGRAIWPVEHTGELLAYATGPEYSDTRDLVTTSSVDDAVAAVQAIRTALQDCRGEDHLVWTEHRADTGYDSVTFSLSYKEGLGLTTFQVTRVGTALLYLSTYGEGTLESARWHIEDRTALTEKLAPQLCGFTEAGC
ncbi:hypothetical protein F0U44_02465 [Nocardioides humilatus]|uniref:Sensor domain-containing protein n=1 Tax=Nocardioides humilatus TaxID=2607660 RepID=A0A5B1LL50_9ACTN|nr:hypothetical protein [Nocardioides humilatus]KAA1421194.1 hypothetical protein F0U44_02465 [Nocardioides humilatus]